MLDLIDLLLTLLLSLPVIVLLAILYGLQLLLYEIFQLVRSTLALTGFIYPEPSDLNDAHGRNLTTPFQCGLQACRQFTKVMATAGSGAPLYPRLTNLFRSHLVCPAAAVEQPITTPNFAAPTANSTPNVFIDQEPLNLDALVVYSESPNPGRTRSLESRCVRIGNAVDLTAFMIGVAADDGASETMRDLAHTNWNLDSDRGYGYKTWDAALPFTGAAPVSPIFVDAKKTSVFDKAC